MKLRELFEEDISICNQPDPVTCDNTRNKAGQYACIWSRNNCRPFDVYERGVNDAKGYKPKAAGGARKKAKPPAAPVRAKTPSPPPPQHTRPPPLRRAPAPKTPPPVKPLPRVSPRRAALVNVIDPAVCTATDESQCEHTLTSAGEYACTWSRRKCRPFTEIEQLQNRTQKYKPKSKPPVLHPRPVSSKRKAILAAEAEAAEKQAAEKRQRLNLKPLSMEELDAGLDAEVCGAFRTPATCSTTEHGQPRARCMWDNGCVPRPVLHRQLMRRRGVQSSSRDVLSEASEAAPHADALERKLIGMARDNFVPAVGGAVAVGVDCDTYLANQYHHDLAAYKDKNPGASRAQFEDQLPEHIRDCL